MLNPDANYFDTKGSNPKILALLIALDASLWWDAQSPVFFLGFIFPDFEINLSKTSVFLKLISWIFFLQKKQYIFLKRNILNIDFVSVFDNRYIFIMTYFFILCLTLRSFSSFWAKLEVFTNDFSGISFVSCFVFPRPIL